MIEKGRKQNIFNDFASFRHAGQKTGLKSQENAEKKVLNTIHITITMYPARGEE